MKFFSVFSLVALSLSVWGLFLTVFNYDSEPEFQVELSVYEEQEEEPAQPIDTEEGLDQGEEIIEPEQLEDEPEMAEVIEEENMPTTLDEQASSRYNDILYDFEKNHPISIDDLLDVLALN